MDLVLFDIDGTLLRTRGAGRESLDEAFWALYGWGDATEGVHIAGSTDGAILRDVCARFGALDAAGAPEVDEATLRAAYLSALARRLAEPGRIEVCPGVFPLLTALRGRVHLGILTGNWRAGATLKLGAVGLLDWFGVGAYGDDAVDRNALVPVARGRADALGLAYDRVVVLGDTPSDVACARAGGAVAIAVETGFASPDEIAAAGPDLQVVDFARGFGWTMALVQGAGT